MSRGIGGKRSFFLFLCLFFFLCGFMGGSADSLGAAEDRGDLSPSVPEDGRTVVWGTKTEILRLGGGYSFFSGSSSWKIGFPETVGWSGSALDFTDLRGGMFLIDLEVNHPQGLISLDLQGSKGKVSGGKGTDSDDLGGTTYYQSRFEVSAETTWWTADLMTAFSSASPRSWVLKPFLGWQHGEDQLRLFHGVWSLLYGLPAEAPIRGLDSRYTFQWDILRMGLKGETDLSASDPQGFASWRLTGYAALFPFIRYRGRGVWNLRDDFKQDPSFTHEAAQGGLLGMDAGLSLIYRPRRWLEWEVGGRLYYSHISSGKDKTYFSNGETVEVTLEEVTTFRAGVFLKMTGRF